MSCQTPILSHKKWPARQLRPTNHSLIVKKSASMCLGLFQRRRVPLPKGATKYQLGKERSAQSGEIVLNGHCHSFPTVDAAILGKFEASQRTLANLIQTHSDPTLSLIKAGYEDLLSALLTIIKSSVQGDHGGQRHGLPRARQVPTVVNKSDEEVEVNACIEEYQRREQQLVNSLSKVLDDMDQIRQAQKVHSKVFEQLKAQGISVEHRLKLRERAVRPPISLSNAPLEGLRRGDHQ